MAKDSDFWRFSLRFYALPGVADACISLQDRHRVDVNVLLFLLFLARSGRAIDQDEAARIDAEVRAWRDGVVVPLRSARRNLRTQIDPIDRDDAEALRAKVKHTELEAERIEQETLERMHPANSTGTQVASREAAARANLSAYGALLGGLPDDLLAPVLQAFNSTSETPR
jgi:uncharacterized protein (TIGR02444 family)